MLSVCSMLSYIPSTFIFSNLETESYKVASADLELVIILLRQEAEASWVTGILGVHHGAQLYCCVLK